MEKPRIKKDVIVIGAGMAGLTAALYAGRMNLSVQVFESAIVGGQIANATEIENYPGLPNVSGKDLISTLQKQAESFGAEIEEFDNILKTDLKEDIKIIETESNIYEADAVIIASGMVRRKMPLEEAPKYEGKGVHYCELCDGHIYQNKIVAVMGGGNAAVDAANFLTKYVKKLYLIHRSKLRADEVSQTKLKENPKVEIMLETEIKALKGENKLETVEILDKANNETKELQVDGIFVNIGVLPNTGLFTEELALLPDGRIKADEHCHTELTGVFAAGDVREKEVRQLTTAAADGTVAAILAEKYIANKRKGKIVW